MLDMTSGASPKTLETDELELHYVELGYASA